MRTIGDPKDSATQTASEDIWKKEISEYLIPVDAQPACGPAVVERCRFTTRLHGVQQEETTATSTLAHVQQFAVRPLRRRRHSPDGRTCEDTIVEQATAKEITHDDVGSVRRSLQSSLSCVTVVDDGKAVLECVLNASITPAAAVTWHVEICQSDDCQTIFTADGWCRHEHELLMTLETVPSYGPFVACPQRHFRFVSAKDIQRVETGNIYISIGLRHHAYKSTTFGQSIQLSVDIYIRVYSYY